MPLEALQLEAHCYVLRQGHWIHPIAKHRDRLVWYPERACTLMDRHCYRPFIKSVVTEDAWIIGCYPREKVRVVGEDGSWEWPDTQTYGASHSSITLYYLGIRATIPSAVLDGGIEAASSINAYTERILKAQKLYA